MNTISRNATRVDRAALGATFAAAVLTLCVSTVAMQPAATPFIAAAQVVNLAADDANPAEPAPCEDAPLAGGEAQPAATGRY